MPEEGSSSLRPTCLNIPKSFLTIDLTKRLNTADSLEISERVYLHVWRPYENLDLTRLFKLLSKTIEWSYWVKLLSELVYCVSDEFAMTQRIWLSEYASRSFVRSRELFKWLKVLQRTKVRWNLATSASIFPMNPSKAIYARKGSVAWNLFTLGSFIRLMREN